MTDEQTPVTPEGTTETTITTVATDTTSATETADATEATPATDATESADATDATPADDDNSHDEVDSVNPYESLPKKDDVLALVQERGLEVPKKATRADLEALLIADDNAKAETAVTEQTPAEKLQAEAQKGELKYNGKCIICLSPVYNKICSGCGRVFK